jgi:hypothetical protein
MFFLIIAGVKKIIFFYKILHIRRKLEKLTELYSYNVLRSWRDENINPVFPCWLDFMLERHGLGGWF